MGVLPSPFLLEYSDKTFFILGLSDLKTHKLKLLLLSSPGASSKNKTNPRALRHKTKAKTRAHLNDTIKSQTSKYLQSYFYSWNFDLCELIRSLFCLSYFALTFYRFQLKGFPIYFHCREKNNLLLSTLRNYSSILHHKRNCRLRWPLTFMTPSKDTFGIIASTHHEIHNMQPW